MRKKALLLLLALCMIAGLMPYVAYADEDGIAISEFEGNEIHGEYRGVPDKDARGNNWSYDAATKTLTLNNFSGSIFALCSKIVLVGENTVRNFRCYSPTIEGSGSLVILGEVYDAAFALGDQMQMVGGSNNGDTMPLVTKDRKIVKPDGTTASYIRIEPIGDAGPATTGRYADVPLTAWYYEAVEYVGKPVYKGYDYGLMDSTSSTTFSPDTNADRATIITALCRRFNFDREGNTFYEETFSDVPEKLGAIVDWAVSSGVVTGYGDGTFGPYDPVTREQFAVMLYRYVQSKNGWRDASVRADLSAYSDSAQISSWATEAMSWANASGYITGTTSTTLNPKGNITRAEVATILMRLC